MIKRKILLFIPLTIIASLLTRTWTELLIGNTIAVWQHYLALFLFIPPAYWFFKDFKKALISTAIYLLIATFNGVCLAPELSYNSYSIRLGTVEIWTPQFQILSFCLFLVYAVLNFNSLVDIYLDLKEWKIRRKQ